MTTRYYHLHPRQFANECTYVRTTTGAEHAEAESYGFERITGHDLVHHIAWMNAEMKSRGLRALFSIEDAPSADDTFASYRNRTAERDLYAAAYGPSN